MTLKPFALHQGVSVEMPVLVALLVCLIPTTIGGLLAAIGIAGMDRLLRRNVLAMSGRAVEAAGDIDVLLLDKTGTITLGNRMATRLVPVGGVDMQELARMALLASAGDETPEGRSIVDLVRQQGIKVDTPAHAEVVDFTAETRMSGLDWNPSRPARGRRRRAGVGGELAVPGGPERASEASGWPKRSLRAEAPRCGGFAVQGNPPARST